MDNLLIGFSGLGLALILLLLRVHIGVALGLVSLVGISIILNVRAMLGIVTAVPFNFVGDWNLSAIPMFLLMGFVASASGLTRGLFDGMRIVFNRLPGAIACSSVMACAMFAAASGSSVATAAAMSRIATPEMLRFRYDPGLASGVIAASGTLGSVIPPSILMVLYGYFAEVSVGQMFMAGFIPGVISAVLYILMIVVRVKVNPSLAPPANYRATRSEKLTVLKEVWPLPVLIIGVLAGIFAGIFTPTEAGAVGASLAFVVAAGRGALTFNMIREALMRTLLSTASIFLVVIGTVLLTRLMALSGVPDFLASLFLAHNESSLMLFVMVALLYLVLGMFVDSIGLMLLTLPIILPVMNELNVDRIWFGILIIKLLEIGLVTPPVGLNVFIIKGALGDLVPLNTIFKGVLWFIAADIIALWVLYVFPALSLWLPGLM